MLNLQKNKQKHGEQPKNFLLIYLYISMSQYVIIRKQLQKKGVGQADKVCTRIFAKEGIYKSAGVFLCKRQVYK
ncbi:MAG: hypothetical protein BHW53_03415 [Ruminococcus sp. CAG:108-related_41_35]|nr:MAG: hypothetical protein BHW53_03415 [Ruminococcus sp. CAG:108-related_41_35]